MKVIFLDFDGVMNSMRWLCSFPSGQVPTGDNQVDPNAVALLNEIIEKTGALVVVSSVWRKCRKYPRTELQEVLNRYGFKGTVAGVTPGSADGIRGGEIQRWMDEYRRPIESFVILDDSSDMAHLMHKLVRTDNQTGLQPDHVARAIEILNAPIAQRDRAPSS